MSCPAGKYSHISIAIPILAELENLPGLMESLRRQTFTDFELYCCVNNPEEWTASSDETFHAMYLDNQASLEYLANIQQSFPQLHIIDCSSPGHGWQGRQRGVGMARKVLLEAISDEHDDNELVVSLDADTRFNGNYLESVLNAMNSNPEHCALSVPYYHPLSGEERNDRAMLRYEIYMRHYLLSLMESDIPYAFTALGSAMVFPLWAYRRVGGFTPLQGGEDFYLMQKFCKTGRILLSGNGPFDKERLDEIPVIVFPQGRQSNRVPFGTGPAVAKGVESMDDSYPLYPYEGFRAVADTYALFPALYDKDIETPMTAFLCEQLKTMDIWRPLRKNFKTRELFVHACMERVDGLRILQFLKTFPLRTAEEELQLFCKRHGISVQDDFSFLNSPIEEINMIRDSLFEKEIQYRVGTVQ